MNKNNINVTYFLCLLILVNMASSRTIRIPADYPTINQGLEAAVPGDSVLVAAGTYTENVILAKDNLNLLGGFEAATWTRDREHQVTVIDGKGGEDAILIDNARHFVIDGISAVNSQQGIRAIMDKAVPVTQEVYYEGFDTGTIVWTAQDLTGDNPHWKVITSHPLLTESSHSPRAAWWCGEDTHYRDNMHDALVLNQPIDLTVADNPYLRFWHWLDKDPDDQAVVDISTDNGVTWNLAQGRYTSVLAWARTEISLAAFKGQVIIIRFRFNSDAYNQRPYLGWFLDDISVVNINPETEVYAFDFEDGEQGFSHAALLGTDNWSLSQARSYSGSQSWHAAENLGSWAGLVSPKLDFSGLTRPRLCFNHWYQFALGPREGHWSNGAIVEVTTDPDAPPQDWQKIYPIGGYPGYCHLPSYGNPLGNPDITGDPDQDGYYGFQTDFSGEIFDLSAYAGCESVWVRFSSGCDNVGYGYEHWYIDDVKIKEAGGEQVLYANNVEGPAAKVFRAQEVATGNWWEPAHAGFKQTDAIFTTFSGDSGMFCGNQNSQNFNGTYDFADNSSMLLDNALVSPWIDLGQALGHQEWTLTFDERRKASVENCFFHLELQPGPDQEWQSVRVTTSGTFSQGRQGGWETAQVDLTGIITTSQIRIRFRCQTLPGFSHLYWYVDTIRLIKKDYYNGIITHCTVRDNQTGIVAEAATGLDVRFCTITRNSVNGITFSQAQGCLDHLILWGNASDLAGCSATFSDIESGVAGEGNIAQDPLWVDPANNDFRLLPGSPAIGMGAWGVYTEVPILVQYARFITTIAELPPEAFVGSDNRCQAREHLEKLFARHPGKKQDKLLELYNRLQQPLYQRLLLYRLHRIEKYVLKEEYCRAARKLEKQVLAHLDGEKQGKEWLNEGFRAPVYAQGRELYNALVRAQESKQAGKVRAKTVAGHYQPPESEAKVLSVPEALLVNFPNPVGQQTTFCYRLKNPAQVRLAIFSWEGKLVKELVNTMAGPGTYQVAWDRTDQHRFRAPAGAYISVLDKNGERTHNILHLVH